VLPPAAGPLRLRAEPRRAWAPRRALRCPRSPARAPRPPGPRQVAEAALRAAPCLARRVPKVPIATTRPAPAGSKTPPGYVRRCRKSAPSSTSRRVVATTSCMRAPARRTEPVSTSTTSAPARLRHPIFSRVERASVTAKRSTAWRPPPTSPVPTTATAAVRFQPAVGRCLRADAFRRTRVSDRARATPRPVSRSNALEVDVSAFREIAAQRSGL